MNFVIDDEQMKLINEWCEKQDATVAKQQEQDPGMRVLRDDFPDITLPYYGGIGGQLQFIFTLCSIGVMVEVKHLWTKEILDVTNYEEW